MSTKPTQPTAQSVHAAWGGTFKAVLDEGVLEGSAIVFGSEQSPDISSFKDFFTEDTFVHPDKKFVTTLYMEHGFSYDEPIGRAEMEKTENGWMATAYLDMENPVVISRFPEIKKGGWGFSTGAVGHVVKREAKDNGTHFIKQWSVGELSITKTPAEPKALIHSVKSLDEYYTAFDNHDTDISDVPGMGGSESHEKLMEVIQMLISELAKKHSEQLEESLSPQLEEIKTQLAELKSASIPTGTDEELNEKLTVLKSENDELKSSNESLQSSFNEKEALLTEKLALLSDTQEQLETKSQELEAKTAELSALEEELTKVKGDVETLTTSLAKAKEINRLLGGTNFNK